MAISTSAAPSNVRKGFHVPVWAAALVGVLVVLAAGFILGRVVADRRGSAVRVDPFGGRVVGGRVFATGGVAHPWLWVVLGLVLLALVIAGVVLLARRSDSAPEHPALQTTKAEELLAERFARGEIDEAEYRSRRDALRT